VKTAGVDELDLKARIGEVLNHWPVAGLAVGVVRHGSLAWFHGHGVADIAAGMPIDQDTVFRIASITKTITAIAVMQLQEQGLVDLDAPASAYLKAYRLIPARPGFRPATLRHLLTHTAGVRAVREPSDLLRPALGWGTRAGRPVPPLAGYYRGGLRIDAEPGTKWAYSNHGFATLGPHHPRADPGASRAPGTAPLPRWRRSLRLPHQPPRVRVGHLFRRVQPRPQWSRHRHAPRRSAAVLPPASRPPCGCNQGRKNLNWILAEESG
jgi:hypothetical protein